MNGYELMARATKQVLEQERDKLSAEEIQSMERDIEIFVMLSALHPKDRYRIFDSSMFNDILTGYSKIAADIIIDNADNEDERERCREYGDRFVKLMRDLLDIHSSEEAETYQRRF